MSQETLSLAFSGLWTSANPFSKSPDGALAQADNVILRDPSLLEPRRGYTATAANPSGTITRVFPWQGAIYTVSANGDLQNYSGGWSGRIGSYTAPDSTSPIRFAAAQKSLFWTSGSGVMQLDDAGNNPLPAGIAPITYLSGTVFNTGTTFLANGSSVAYCAVLCRYDANGNLIQSAPSYSLTLTNSTGSAGNAVVTVLLPQSTQQAGATFAQLYRTVSTTGTPNGEFFQVAEHTFTAADLTAGQFSFPTDISQDSFLTVPCYTNANTGSGLGASNDLPPLARDLVLFQDRLLYFNTTDRHSLDLRLTGVDGITVPTTVLVLASAGKPNVTVFAGASALPTSGRFFYDAAGTPAVTVETTARSIAQVITVYSALQGNPVVATYTSGANDTPGMIHVEEVGIGGSAFAFQATAGFPNMVPDLSAPLSSVTSDNNRQPAGMAWSNEGEPWGVPADNRATIGASDKAILRAVLVRSTVFVFKEDGLFTVQFGGDGFPIITAFDPSLVLLAPESLNVLQNQIFCLTNRGYVAISENGVSPAVSKPIERDVNATQALATQYTTAAFGVAYEAEGLSILALPSTLAASAAGCNQQYVFNAGNPSWTRWLIANARHGCFDPVSGGTVWAVDNTLWFERRTFTSSDFQNPDGSAIPCTWRFLPITAGNPTSEKRFSSLLLSFKTCEPTSFTVGFDNDKPTTTLTITRSGPSLYGWGSFSWGSVPWGQASQNYLSRTDLPQAMAASTTLGVTISVSQPATFWQLQGLSLLWELSTPLPRRS